MKLYQTLHANEKPIDLTNKPPFENSENLSIKEKPEDWIYLGSKKKLEAIEEKGLKKEKNLLLEDKKEEKPTETKEKKTRDFSFYSMNLHYT